MLTEGPPNMHEQLVYIITKFVNFLWYSQWKEIGKVASPSLLFTNDPPPPKARPCGELKAQILININRCSG